MRLPPEAPLDMPVRSLDNPPRPVAGLSRSMASLQRPVAMLPRPVAVLPRPVADTPTLPAIAQPGLVWRRVAVLGGAVALTAVATAEMGLVLGLARWTVSGAVMAVIFALLFFWIAFAFTSGLAGFVCLMGRGAPEADLTAIPRSRTALLMPIHHESMERLRGGLLALRADLADSGVAQSFDIFILSDTRDAALQAAELEVWRDLHAQVGPALYYRNRAEPSGRKAGNIAEWVRRFGAAYPQFLILDADSLMEARTLRHLVHRMEAEPGLGLIQTLPLLHGGRTRFARLQQFASQVYGPVIAQGVAWWSGSEGNYWGHNALIRTRAFAQAAGLPELPGRKPFGGVIMSHDFVEAALLRRAGWAVVMDARLGGSFEEGPPNLPEMAGRDRRWCQGNLQHLALIATPGLHPISRLHLLGGACAYLNAPLWLGFLLLGLVISLQARVLRPEYFPVSHALFPQWPVVDAERAVWVFGATMALLLAPKLMGVMVFILRSARPPDAPGVMRLLGGAGAEIVLSALLSPVTMLIQSGHCVTILRGADGGWAAQQREATAWSLRASLRLMHKHVIFGLLLGATALAIDPQITAWLAPVILGLLLAPWLVAWTSYPPGPALAAVLRTPLEMRPPPILLAAREGARARQPVAPILELA